jgi:predicted AAA+ superfamily ATPase
MLRKLLLLPEIPPCSNGTPSSTIRGSLLALKAYHKRYPNSKLFVITMDEEETIIYEAVVIEVLPVWKWLLMEK